MEPFSIENERTAPFNCVLDSVSAILSITVTLAPYSEKMQLFTQLIGIPREECSPFRAVQPCALVIQERGYCNLIVQNALLAMRRRHINEGLKPRLYVRSTEVDATVTVGGTVVIHALDGTEVSDPLRVEKISVWFNPL